MERNRYADLLRVGALGLVVIGHWLVTDITYRHGQLSGLDALYYISWGRWVTLFFQVMPIFFLVGGYVNAISWVDHRASGETWAGWARGRALRLLWPAAVYVAVAVVAVSAARLAGVGRVALAEAAWFVALQLWFLPVYLLLILLTPAMLAAHRRWGLAVPVLMAAGAGAVNAAAIGWHVPVIGFLNYLLVWGSMHQWGFGWREGWLGGQRWHAYALAGVGLVALALLLSVGPFPIDMIGAGGPVQNTSPPSVALLALAAVQSGLLIAVELAGRRMMAAAGRWRVVSRLNDATMTVYLWHMAPVVVVAVALYPAGLAPQPGVGSWQWWALRPAWFAVLALVLVPVTIGVMRLERPLARLPAGNAAMAGWWPQALLLAGIAGSMVGLARLAIAGFAPSGSPPVLVLVIFAAGLACTMASGFPVQRHGSGAGAATRAVVPS